jgi:two-component system, cell cycle response regulator
VSARHESVDRRGRDRVVTATVLVVDDSSATRRILRRTLEAVGYGVTEAADGLEALGVCRAEPPDLVLLDIDMPVMDGPTLLARLQEDDDLAEIPVIFLTARTSGTDVAAGLQLGAHDYLRKPCEPVELEARVGAALYRRSQHRSLRETALEADRLSTVDALTGIPNRRQFARRRDQLLATSVDGTTVGLIVVDVDHFKQVNDNEGHLVGDAVLRILARRLLTAMAPEQLLVRWGGEEFLVLAPGLPEEATRALARRLHLTVRATPFAVSEERSLPVTISVGCVSGRLHEIDALIPFADEALYEAKRGGRDCVVHRVAPTAAEGSRAK